MLTREKIKEALDKNALWEDIVKEICHCVEAFMERTESDDSKVEEKLSQRYRSGVALVEERVRDEIACQAELGRQELAELWQEESELEKRCLEEGESFDIKRSRLQKKQEDIKKKYFYTKEQEDALRKQYYESFIEFHEKDKQELQLRNSIIAMAELLNKLKAKVPPSSVRVLHDALAMCDINREAIWYGKNRRYISIGYRYFKMLQWPQELNQFFTREYGCIMGAQCLQVPFAVNHNSGENLPVLVYQDSKNRNFEEGFRTLCTAYCLTRYKEPLQILHTEKLGRSQIVPEAYASANPHIFHRIPKGRENVCLAKLMAYYKEIKALLDRENVNSVMEYNKIHEEASIAHYVLVLEDLPDSFGRYDIANLTFLLKEGGNYGVKVLACMELGKLSEIKSRKNQEDEIYKDFCNVLNQCGYGYQPTLNRYEALKTEGEELAIQPLIQWSEDKRPMLRHQEVNGELPCLDMLMFR